MASSRRSILIPIVLGLAVAAAAAQPPATPASAASAAVTLDRVGAYPPLPWQPVARVPGRLTAAQLGLVINTADPFSVATGEYYARKRKLAPAQVLRVELPQRDALNPQELEALRARIDGHFGGNIQALALAWKAPYAVGCNSITGALTLGYDAGLCANSCGRSRESLYASAPSPKPLRSHGMRLTMLLAAGTVESAQALIDRGVAADSSLGRRGAPPALALLATSGDKARNVRASLYPPVGLAGRSGVMVDVLPHKMLAGQERVLLVQAGIAKPLPLEGLKFVPGALADHLTSYGGALNGTHGHSTALDWIDAGATASHGTVSEPCNHLQKFPHPQWLLQHYLQGASAIEAYWRSVLWPQQSLFVGEPLAAPFAPPAAGGGTAR